MSPEPSHSAAAESLRELPSVDTLLRHHATATLLDEHPRSEVLAAIRLTLDERRREILAGRPTALDSAALALEVRETLYRRSLPSLRRVINATGIVLHTGLGRSPLAEEAVEAVAAVAGGYSNLELDLETGERGDRHTHARALLCELTGAEDALIVNNNAAATYLALRALAAGREAVISRGQLVEIGGSYRMPEIMAAAGCRMVEVGTTNRTRVEDYRAAITAQTAVLMRVHTSNYRIVGFTESVPLVALVELARSASTTPLAVIDDLGSGLLSVMPSTPTAAEPPAAAPVSFALWDEPPVRESVAAGADLTLFSGDKLLGGPQAGIAVGRGAMVARLRRDPLMRALRPDKMTLAALEATLRLHRDPVTLTRRLPVYRMLACQPAELEARATALAAQLHAALPELSVETAADRSYAGGGALPGIELPTWTVTVQHHAVPSDAIAAALRRRETPVIARLRDGMLIFDARTLRDGESDELVAALSDALRELA